MREENNFKSSMSHKFSAFNDLSKQVTFLNSFNCISKNEEKNRINMKNISNFTNSFQNNNQDVLERNKYSHNPNNVFPAGANQHSEFPFYHNGFENYRPIDSNYPPSQIFVPIISNNTLNQFNHNPQYFNYNNNFQQINHINSQPKFPNPFNNRMNNNCNLNSQNFTINNNPFPFQFNNTYENSNFQNFSPPLNSNPPPTNNLISGNRQNYNNFNNLNSNYLHNNLNKVILENYEIPNINYFYNNIKSKNNQKRIQSFNNYPQKNITENLLDENGDTSNTVNNYFNYIFNNTNVNQYQSQIFEEKQILNNISTNTKYNLNPNLEKINQFSNIHEKKQSKLNEFIKSPKEDATYDISNNKCLKNVNLFLNKEESSEFLYKNSNQMHSKTVHDINTNFIHNKNKIFKEIYYTKNDLIAKETMNEILDKNTTLNKNQPPSNIYSKKFVENNKHKLNNFSEKNDSNFLKSLGNKSSFSSNIETIASNKIKDQNENIEILKVVLLNVKGIDSNTNDNSLSFIIHKNDDLFKTFNSFLKLNNISEKFEFPILVNVFQAISTIYKLNNSIISKKDENGIKILYNIWRNHCLLKSLKHNIINKEDDLSNKIQENLKCDLEEILNSNLDDKNLNYRNNNFNVIKNIGLFESCSEDSNEDNLYDQEEQNSAIDFSSAFSCDDDFCDDDNNNINKNSYELLNRTI